MKRFLAAAFCGLIIYMSILPRTVASAREAPAIKSETAVVMDAATGQVLYNKDMDKVMPPASITKILTGLLAVELGDMSDEITFTDDIIFSIDRSSSHIALQNGETITLEQAMYAMSIESANDAAAGIGRYLSEKTGKGLSQLMNERAKAAGAKSSNFVNPHGLPDDNHYTTAYDMAMIARECVKYDLFNKIFSTGEYTLPATNKQKETRVFHSTNWFFVGAFDYDGVLMSKIGWTTESGHTMVTRVKRGETTLICVVMNSTGRSDKWDDTELLCDWVFDNFKSARVTGSYVALCAPEEIPCDSSGRLFVRKEDITAQGANVLLSRGDEASSVKAAYSSPSLSRDMKEASFTVTLYTGQSDRPTVLGTVSAKAPVSERSRVMAPIIRARRHPVTEVVLTMIFGLFSFIAIMTADVMISRRI